MLELLQYTVTASRMMLGLSFTLLLSSLFNAHIDIANTIDPTQLYVLMQPSILALFQKRPEICNRGRRGDQESCGAC